MNNVKKTNAYKHWDFFVMDLICIEVAFLIACQLRRGIFPALTRQYVNMAVLLAVGYMIIVFFWNIYSGIMRRGFWAEMRSIIASNAGLFAFLNGYLFFTKTSAEYSRVIVLVFVILNLIFMIIAHQVLKTALRRRARRNPGKMLILAEEEDIAFLVEMLQKEDHTGEMPTGIILPKKGDAKEIAGLPVVADLSELENYLDSCDVDAVFIHLKNQDTGWIVDEITARGFGVYSTLPVLEQSVYRYRVEPVKGFTALTIREREMPFGRRAVRRVIDFFGALLALVITSPIFLIVAIAIKREDKGPVLYASKRIGYKGKTIHVYKFRSMKQNADRLEDMLSEEELEQYRREYKLENDPRVTRVGKFLRRTSLDELPQLLNILKGDMSFVGPRPVLQEETELYGNKRNFLLSIKPGLTGYWQSRGRNNITYESGERQDMEIYYVSHSSWGLDFKILFWTIKAIIKKDGVK